MNRALLFIALLCVAAFGQQQLTAIYTLTMTVPNYVSMYNFDGTTGAVTYVNQTVTGGNGVTAGGIQSSSAITNSGDNFLLAVNPGSNTVSLFYIDPTNPFNLTWINQTSTGGDYPISVTARNGLACVANSGVQNGLRCFTYSLQGIFPIAGTDRSFGLTLTNPPVSHTGPGQIAFDPTGEAIVVSNKGARPPVWIWSFRNNNISATPVTTNHTAGVPFSFAFDTEDPNGSILLTDTSPSNSTGGVALLKYTSDNSGIPTIGYATNYTLVNGSATCWVNYAGNHAFFVSNSGSGSISVVNTDPTAPSVTVVQTYLINNGTAKPLDLMHILINNVNFLVFLSTNNTLYSQVLMSDLTPAQPTFNATTVPGATFAAGLAMAQGIAPTPAPASSAPAPASSAPAPQVTPTPTVIPVTTGTTGTPTPTPITTGTTTGTPTPTPTPTPMGTPSPIPTTPTTGTPTPTPSPSGASSSIVSLFMALILVCYYLI